MLVLALFGAVFCAIGSMFAWSWFRNWESDSRGWGVFWAVLTFGTGLWLLHGALTWTPEDHVDIRGHKGDVLVVDQEGNTRWCASEDHTCHVTITTTNEGQNHE